MKVRTPNGLLVYDIPDDVRSAKIADACLDYGLDRFQYCAYTGWLLAGQQDELMLKLKNCWAKSRAISSCFPCAPMIGRSAG